MLNDYSVRMTCHGLGFDKVVILEEVLSIKFSLKRSLSIFTIAHYQSPDVAISLLETHQILDVASSLLALSKSR